MGPLEICNPDNKSNTVFQQNILTDIDGTVEDLWGAKSVLDSFRDKEHAIGNLQIVD